MIKKYYCFKVKQRDSDQTAEFVTFVALASEVNQWAGVRRVGAVENGIQRILKEPRVKAIKRFFTSDPINTIPVSAIIAFTPGTATFQSLTEQLLQCIPGQDLQNGLGNKGEWGILTFDYDPETPEEERPAVIVDGQHRINGMALVGEEIPIAISAYIGADIQEQAFQFVVINNKAQKVPTDNVKAIISHIDEDTLQKRLLKAGVSYGKYPATLGDIDELDDSPFYQLLDWPLNTEGTKLIQLTTIESCLRYIRDTLPILAEDEDSLKSLFITCWNAVKSTYPALWGEDNKFMSKVNIIAVNEFIIDRLENWSVDNNYSLYESDIVSEYIEKVLIDVPVEYWQEDWTTPLQDNAVVRSRIKDDLRKITQNIRASRNWNDGLKNIAQ